MFLIINTRLTILTLTCSLAGRIKANVEWYIGFSFMVAYIWSITILLISCPWSRLCHPWYLHASDCLVLRVWKRTIHVKCVIFMLFPPEFVLSSPHCCSVRADWVDAVLPNRQNRNLLANQICCTRRRCKKTCYHSDFAPVAVDRFTKVIADVQELWESPLVFQREGILQNLSVRVKCASCHVQN